MNRALFLDRDGVIIENRTDYVRSWDDVQILPRALETLSRLSKTHFKIVIVTNQSAVGRGIITLKQAEEINQRLVHEIELSGGRVDGVYMCPHSPENMCRCRKPNPGMFLDAAANLSLDLENSIMIGDAATDLIAANEAGVSELIFVLTGRGEQQLSTVKETGLPFETFESFDKALIRLLSE